MCLETEHTITDHQEILCNRDSQNPGTQGKNVPWEKKKDVHKAFRNFGL